MCLSTESDGWREEMRCLIGKAPAAGEDKTVPAGATYTWIVQNFSHCPRGADADVILIYARVYVWYVITRSLFADGSGNTAPWLWLKQLTLMKSNFSWGSAALAYLYRQLDDACRRSKVGAGIGGPMLLLSVWSWDRITVGRPKEVSYENWAEYGGHCLRRPTWAYKYDVVSEAHGDVDALYIRYTNELDALTPEQVTWEPYGSGDRFGYTPAFVLNPKCTEERNLWLMRCPLICHWAVEYHMPQRVMRQFGLFQTHPPEYKYTDRELHRLDRKRQRTIKKWDKHHKNYVSEFKLCVEKAKKSGWGLVEPHCPDAFSNYITWLRENTRLSYCEPAYKEDILEDPIEYDMLGESQYNKLIRDGTQIPFSSSLNFVHKEIKKQADESQMILETNPRGKRGESALQNYIKSSNLRLRRLSNLLGCRDPEYVSPTPSASRSNSTAGIEDDQEDETNSAAHTEDESLPRMENETEEEYRVRSAYMLKPRRDYHRYSPSDYDNNGKNTVVEEERPRRSRRTRGINYDDDAGEEDPHREVMPKIAPRRGKGPKTRGGTRGRK